jgi:integrase/recombinase XerD
MPAALSCTISKITTIPNKVNSDIISEYHHYVRDNGASERHQNSALKAVIGYAKFLGENTTLHDINLKEQITTYLDTKTNSIEQDPDKKWITTWNDHMQSAQWLAGKA